MHAPVVLIIGTRPEGIKLLPLYFALQRAEIPTFICSTAQHSELLSEVFEIFNVMPDISLNIMRPGQDLFYVTQSVLQKTKELFMQLQPSLVVVQGDTTSGMAAALSAFYLKVPVAHVEAGLRTDDLYAPFPEEMNRRVLRALATYHFAPTSWAAAQLLTEGVAKNTVFCVGNTVVDALRLIGSRIDDDAACVSRRVRLLVERAEAAGRKLMLFTMHRRESFDGGVQRVLCTLKEWLQEHPEIVCMYPYHPNPAIINALQDTGFTQLDNVLLVDPLTYIDLVYVLRRVALVATDSGGIQEEAVSLGKSAIVLREKTERIEAVWAGAAHIVGTDAAQIRNALNTALESTYNHLFYAQLFGDGYAAEKMVHILKSTVNFMPGRVSVRNESIKKRNQAMRTVCVLGLGYIGLPTSIILAEAGYAVIGVDVDAAKVAAINSGDAVIKEPELFEKLQIVLSQHCFSATTIVPTADYFIVAVPTPFKEQKQADLTYVYAAIESIIPVLKKGDVIVIESTIPVGTTEAVATFITQKTGLIAGADYAIAHCPERVLPGNIFHELTHNARIIGGLDHTSMEKAKALYASFVTGELYLTDAKTAELIKLIENSSRDVQIAFAHQVASMAHAIGLNPYEVIELANKHPRVQILSPSSGVGGHCIAVDPWFLVESFPHCSALIKCAREVNDLRPQQIIEQIKDAVEVWRAVNQRQPVLALCGMTYKPDVDDLRESPALLIAEALAAYQPIICEPHILGEIQATLFERPVAKITEVVEQADIIVFLVAHKRFKIIDAVALQHKKVLDFCGILHTPKAARGAQEYYFWPASKQTSNAHCGHQPPKEQVIE